MPNRIIKESIWTSETLSKLSFRAQMFFFRLLPVPDDHGCFDARPEVIRGKLFPFMLDKVKVADVRKWLKELEVVDCIRFWTHTNGITYGLFPKWSEHQNIRSLHQRKTPEPPESVTSNKTTASSFDSECNQVQSSDSLNPNHNPDHNPKKPVAEKPPRPKGEVTDGTKALRFWKSEYRRVIGKEADTTPVKDQTILKRLVEKHGLDEVMARIPRHIAGGNLLSIGGFKTKFNDLTEITTDRWDNVEPVYE